MNEPIITLNIYATDVNGTPAIELRRHIRDTKLLKLIITSALKEQPLIIMPVLNNKFKALASLQEKGIIYKEGETYYFNLE
jgi:hypothetical protein